MPTTYLDASLTASRARLNKEIRATLTGLLKEALVVVMSDTYHYRVDFGPDVRPRIHIVSWDLVCACSQTEDCPAVTGVKKYLQDGGQPAEIPRPGYWPSIPHKCPLCGAKVHYDPQLSSKRRGLGWSCAADKAHYWKYQGQTLAQASKGKNVAPLNDARAFPFPEGYDPNREYPTVCRHCGQPV